MNPILSQLIANARSANAGDQLFGRSAQLSTATPEEYREKENICGQLLARSAQLDRSR